MEMILMADTHSKTLMQTVVHNVLKLVDARHSLGDEIQMNVT